MKYEDISGTSSSADGRLIFSKNFDKAKVINITPQSPNYLGVIPNCYGDYIASCLCVRVDAFAPMKNEAVTVRVWYID